MKKSTTVQALFDNLSPDLITENPIEEDAVSPAQIERIRQKVHIACNVRTVRPRRRTKWLIPLVAVLSSLIVVTAAAVNVFTFSPQYSYFPPEVTFERSHPTASEYKNAVEANISTEANGINITLDSYTVDTLHNTLRMSVTVESTDGTILNELSPYRKSVIPWNTFDSLSLSKDGKESLLITRGMHVWAGNGNDWVVCERSDNGNDPYKATFQLRYYLNSTDRQALIDKDYVLQFTDITDVVRVCDDLGFTFETMKSLFEELDIACADDYRKASVYNSYTDGDVYYYTLADSGQKIHFSAKWNDAYIDNIGFYHEEIGDVEDFLYISFANLPKDKEWPVLIDVTTGILYESNVRGYNPEKGKSNDTAPWNDAQELHVTDGDRVTLCYPGITEDMLGNLFMMQGHEYEHPVRAQGEWSIPFTITADSAMEIYSYETDVQLQYHEYDFHVTGIDMTDSSVYLSGNYYVNDIPQGETAYATMYGQIDLILKDGTVIDDPIFQGADADPDIWETHPGDTGECRFGGEFQNYINAEDVSAIIVFGQTIPLPSS